MNKINVAVLGLGVMGGTHAEEIRQSPHVKTIFGYEPDPQRCRERCAELKIEPATLEEILGDSSVKLLLVASPNETHVPYAIKGLRSGKAVLCEKPMGGSLAEAAELLRVEKETGGFLQIGFELRYCTLYLKAKEWIDQGLIGDLVNVQCRYYCCEFHKKETWRSRGTGSFLIGEKLCHYLDAQRWWFGQSPESIYSVAAPKVVPYFGHRDNHQMILKFPGGGGGTLNFIMYMAETLHHDPLINVLDKQSDDGHFLQFHICGSRCAIETDVFKRRIRRWQFRDAPTCLESRIVETVTFPASDDLETFHNTLGQNLRVAELVAQGGRPDLSARDAYETMKVCFAAERSEDEGRIVALDEYPD